jgi:hypothetical protein
MKLDLLTNATVVDDAVRFVSEHYNGRVESATANSKESITITTREEATNQIF